MLRVVTPERSERFSIVIQPTESVPSASLKLRNSTLRTQQFTDSRQLMRLQPESWIQSLWCTKVSG